MKDYIFSLATALESTRQGKEEITMWCQGESSDFVRFNHNKIRQSGNVEQHYVALRLISDQKHASVVLPLTKQIQRDTEVCKMHLSGLRERIVDLPDDPYLFLEKQAHFIDQDQGSENGNSAQAIEDIQVSCHALDMVGIFAGGSMYRAFTSSFGTRNWMASENFHFDYSLYAQKDKAAKSSLAGRKWNAARFKEDLGQTSRQLEMVNRSPKTIRPGKYRVFLSPSAMAEILGLMRWGGFGMQSQRTKQSPLLHIVNGERALSEKISLCEDTSGGIGPAFQSDGWSKPSKVAFIQKGRWKDSLISPRSGAEYDVQNNGASAKEIPESLSMAAGQLASEDILSALDEGLYINQLWYMNYSDRQSCRMTGMTRFATFWVENGEIKAPLNVMRFDDSLYRMLGEHLIDLTQERRFLLEAKTYHQRSTQSVHTPGALINDFTLTL